MTSAGYSFGPMTVDVLTEEEEANRWLAAFLTPWMRPVPFGRGALLVHFSCSQNAFEALEASASAGSRLSPCFALDNQIVMLPSWDDGESTVLADTDLHCFYKVRRRRVDIVGRPGERRTRLGLMRVVREVLTPRRPAHESVLDLHASAFEAAGRGVLIAGPKNAGKTTLLCYALASGRTRVIANDRVLVGAGADSAEVCGIPTLIGVRAETLRFFPTLRGGQAGQPILLHADEEEPDPDAVARGVHVRSLSPAEFARRLGASVVRAAPLSAVVFPEIDAAASTWILEQLSRAEGVSRLASCIHGVGRGEGGRTVLGDVALPGRAERPSAAPPRRVAPDVPLFRLLLGPRAYERSAVEWLHGLGLAPADAPTGHAGATS